MVRGVLSLVSSTFLRLIDQPMVGRAFLQKTVICCSFQASSLCSIIYPPSLSIIRQENDGRLFEKRSNSYPEVIFGGHCDGISAREKMSGRWGRLSHQQIDISQIPNVTLWTRYQRRLQCVVRRRDSISREEKGFSGDSPVRPGFPGSGRESCTTQPSLRIFGPGHLRQDVYYICSHWCIIYPGLLSKSMCYNHIPRV